MLLFFFIITSQEYCFLHTEHIDKNQFLLSVLIIYNIYMNPVTQHFAVIQFHVIEDEFGSICQHTRLD